MTCGMERKLGQPALAQILYGQAFALSEAPDRRDSTAVLISDRPI